ncbi:MAG: hypothetical protein ACRDL7_08365, partial [Gaiellaceae bacterium]
MSIPYGSNVIAEHSQPKFVSQHAFQCIACRYEDLWLNLPKEIIEYFDYTFDDHFKKPTPIYLPRSDIWDYLTARNNRLGALNNVKYNCNVENVIYDEILKKFIVTVKDDGSNETTPIIQLFDKCIWACGVNGEAKKPRKLMHLLSSGFAGKYYHSVEATENFANDVHGKRLLLIGGSTSAEDLALRAIKHGVDHVYISTRTGDGTACYMGSWPQGKVSIIYGVPIRLIGDRSFKCRYDDGPKSQRKVTDVHNIDVVILCTGYDCNQSMLD